MSERAPPLLSSRDGSIAAGREGRQRHGVAADQRQNHRDDEEHAADDESGERFRVDHRGEPFHQGVHEDEQGDDAKHGGAHEEPETDEERADVARHLVAEEGDLLAGEFVGLPQGVADEALDAGIGSVRHGRRPQTP